MGFENLYGLGKGQAQVFNSANLVNTYARQLQQKGLQRQKEQEIYAKELEGIDWSGARNPTEEAHFKGMWEKVLDLNHKRYTSDKKDDRMAYSSQISTIKKEMLAGNKRAQNEAKLDADIAAKPLSTPTYGLAKDFGQRLKERRETSIFDPRFKEYGVELFQAQAKPLDLNREVDEMAKFAAKQINIEGTRGEGLEKRYTKTKGLQLSEEVFKTMVLQRMDNDDQFQDESLRGLEPTPENLDVVAETFWNIAKDKYKPDTVDGDRVHEEAYQLNLYKKKKDIAEMYEDDDDSTSSTFESSTLIPYGKPKDNSFVKVFNTQKLSPSRINITGTEGINLVTGKPMRVPNLESSVSVGTIADVPIIGGSLKMGGRVSQPKFAQDNPDKVTYRRHAFVTFKDGSGTDQTLLIPVEALPTTNKIINKALKSMPQETYKHPKESSHKNEYSNVRTLVGKDGKSVQAGIKDNKWFNIATGKTL